ncbi:partitioning defective 3 homolog [Ornithodoros turicata]|uniref:partitioning defective 3 homolog n=1 Tax=Ornithodoros turicata TaxID=34597 RepID=UPI003138D427
MRLFRRRSPPPPELIRLWKTTEQGALQDDAHSRIITSKQDAMAVGSSASAATANDNRPPKTSKTKRGFPFSRVGLKSSAGPHRYSVTTQTSPAPEQSRKETFVRKPSSTCVDWPRRLATFAHPIVLNNRESQSPPPAELSRATSRSVECLDEPTEDAQSMVPLGSMYRSMSTSALFVESMAETSNESVKSLSCEELDKEEEEESTGAAEPSEESKAAKSVLGTVFEDEVYLERDKLVAPDTASLASSIQHRSDESGYESDGTKNGGDESPAEGVPVTNEEVKRPQTPGEVTNMQRFAALLQRLSPQSSTATSSVPAKDQHASLPCDHKTFRSRTQSLFLALRRDSVPKNDTVQRETPKKVKEGGSKLEQFRAWTLDRKLLKNRWKKNAERNSLFDSPLLNRDAQQECNLKSTSWSSAECLSDYIVPVDSGLESDLQQRLWQGAQLDCSENSVEGRLPSNGGQFINVHLEKDEQGELGIYITGRYDPERRVIGYVVADLEDSGPAARSGLLHKGDELLVINGHQVQGVEIEQAQRLLCVQDRDVFLLVARQHNSAQQVSSPADEEELRKVDDHRPPMERRASISHPGASVDVPEKTERRDQQYSSGVLCTLPRKRKGQSQTDFQVVSFVKGPGQKALGFSIVGGRDSPKGAMGIYVKSIFLGGQAAETGQLREGDEIITLNGEPLQGMSHAEAISSFKRIKQGDVVLHIARRVSTHKSPQVSKSCCDLDTVP